MLGANEIIAEPVCFNLRAVQQRFDPESHKYLVGLGRYLGHLTKNCGELGFDPVHVDAHLGHNVDCNALVLIQKRH